MRAFKLRLDIFLTTKSVTHICNEHLQWTRSQKNTMHPLQKMRKTGQKINFP